MNIEHGVMALFCLISGTKEGARSGQHGVNTGAGRLNLIWSRMSKLQFGVL